MPLKQIQLTTDGSCQPNPGRGGWAAILRYGSSCRELTGTAPCTTNNRMELTAIIEGLRALKEPCRVSVRTDSKTCIAWCAPTSFATKSAKQDNPMAYALVLEYRRIAAKHEIEFEWVRGHVGDRDNERCDALALDACQRPF